MNIYTQKVKENKMLPVAGSLSGPKSNPSIAFKLEDNRYSTLVQRKLLETNYNKKPSKQQVSNSSTIQRIIIQGGDSNENSDQARVGMSKLMSQSEIQNSNEFMKSEKRNGNGIYSVAQLENEKLPFDAMNYLNGHHVAGGTYFSMTAEKLAETLKKAGLESRHHISLIGCESAGFAIELADQLHRRGITIKIIGAAGIAFDYKDDDGAVKEAMFDKHKIPEEADTTHNEKNKWRIAHKYEEIFINEVTSRVFQKGPAEDQAALLSCFKILGKQKIKFIPHSKISPGDIESLEKAQARFKEEIGKANKNGETLKGVLTIGQLIAISQQNPMPGYSKQQFIDLRMEAGNYIPRTKDVGGSADELRAQSLEGKFLLEKYTAQHQYWISGFMKSIAALKDGDLKTFLLNTYIHWGRIAANEYIKTMAKGYQADAAPAVIANGWKIFDHTGKEISSHPTFRQAADNK